MPTANKPPVKLWIMNVAKFIADNHCMPVSSVFIREPSTNEFKHDGLFSEDIFGQVNTPDRLVRMGYIDLRTKLIHPLIYRNITKLKALYAEIMGRTTYARFDQDTCEFIRSTDDDEEADSGYEFFMSHFNQLKFSKNTSLTHNEMIDVFENNRANAIIQQCIVMPAGLRDLREDEAKPATDSINKLYSSLINYTLALPAGGTNSDIYDNIRFSMQKKVNEIYEYIFEMSSGKRGFFQSRYAARSLALGTRNVVSTANMSAKTPDDPQYLKMDEMKIPLFQVCKMFTPLMVYALKVNFFNDIFNITTDQVALIDPKTNNLVYQAIDEDEKSKFLTSEGINKIIDLFRDQDTRFLPVSVYTEDGKEYYLFMVYDDGELIYISRSVAEIANKVKADLGFFDPSKVRPLTYAEMLYVAAFTATRDKHAFVTRYPAIEIGSEIPNKVHVASTNPGRTVHVRSTKSDNFILELPEYPIIGRAFVDSLVPHPQLLAGMGMDFDGNCLSGDTVVQIRYVDGWLDSLRPFNLIYTDETILANYSDQDITQIIETIKNKTTCTDAGEPRKESDGYYYARIRMDEFPQPGIYMLDKNQAKVYSVPEGCEVLSYLNGVATWQPITNVTVEEGCDVTTIYICGREITVSNNESVAIFDHETGGLIKVKPSDASMRYIPVLKRDPQPIANGSSSDLDAGRSYIIPETGLTETELVYLLNNKSREYLKGILLNHLKITSVGDDVTAVEPVIEILKENEYDLITAILYRLGIRYAVASHTNATRVGTMLYPEDLDVAEVKINVYAKGYITQQDLIPITETERVWLLNLSYRLHDSLLCRLVNDVTCLSLQRNVLKEYSTFISSDTSMQALSTRINNTDVVWAIPEIQSGTTTTVYDFIVPEAKVFCVNNGVVVYDTASANGVLSKQANEENAKYLNSLSRYMHSNGSLMHRTTDLVKLTIYNLSRNPV